MVVNLWGQDVPARQRRALNDLILLDDVGNVVKVDHASAEDRVEAEHGQPAVVPDADLESPMAQLALLYAVLQSLLEDRACRLPLGLGLALRVGQPPVRSVPLVPFKDSRFDVGTWQ